MAQAFEQAVRQLPGEWCERLLRFPKEERHGVREITFRAGKPVTLTTAAGIRFMDRQGGFLPFVPPESACIGAEEVNRCLRHLTQYSLHTFEQELCGGYLTIQGGHRCGIAGSAVYKDSQLSHIRDVSCISLRIARQIRGLSAPVLYRLYGGITPPSVLLIGAPASGKTTLLRDLIRGLASGEIGRFVRIAAVDERGELGAALHGIAQLDLGVTADLLDGFQKEEGMRMALRALSPEVIVVDEIASDADMEAVRRIQRGGAAVLAAAHAASLADAYRRGGLGELLKEGAFDYAAVLEGAKHPGKVARIASLHTGDERICG